MISTKMNICMDMRLWLNFILFCTFNGNGKRKKKILFFWAQRVVACPLIFFSLVLLQKEYFYFMRGIWEELLVSYGKFIFKKLKFDKLLNFYLNFFLLKKFFLKIFYANRTKLIHKPHMRDNPMIYTRVFLHEIKWKVQRIRTCSHHLKKEGINGWLMMLHLFSLRAAAKGVKMKS